MPDYRKLFKDLEYTDSHYSVRVAKFEIEVEGLHNFKELYKRVYDWLQYEDYMNVQTHEPDLYETMYWERQHATGHREHNIWWRAYKPPVKDDTSDYFTYFFKINYQTIRLKGTETMHKGKKWSTHESDTILRISAFLIINDKDWESGKGLFGGFLKAIRPRFRAWLYKDKIWFHREYLYRKSFELQNIIKEYLGERLSQDLPPNIYKEKGLG
jgi:hypothetical protein